MPRVCVRACAITRYYNIIYKNKILLLYIYFNAREEISVNQLIICKNFKLYLNSYKNFDCKNRKELLLGRME